MSNEHDPVIQQLFDIARQESPGDAFVAGVMARVNSQRQRVLLVWGFVALVLFAVAAILSGPVTEAVGLLTRLMPQPLVQADSGNALLTQLLTPLNSVAAVVGLGLLALIFVFRKIFGGR